MCRKFIYLVCFGLVMSLAGSAVADLVAYVNSSEVVVTPVEVLSFR